MKNPEMDPVRWRQLDELLDAALELPTDQRSAFLDQACAGDDALRFEIDQLLAQDDQVRSFIETPAFHATPEQTDTSHLVSLLKGGAQLEPLLRTGRLVAGRYQTLTRLGKGGMGEVWHAYDLKLRIDVALKSLRHDLYQRPEELVDLIRREVRTAREVVSANVCRIFDLVSEEDQELISMEYIDGITLMKMMEQSGPLDLREARDIAAQFLAGLDAIHAAGLVHRDLKPENIMITRTGRVVVMDLGIAEPVAQTGSVISGTFPYMSPEQLAGGLIDARSDIFSAGVVLAEMVGTRGTESKNTRELIWKAVREDPMQLPDGPWKALLARAVASNRENRFESASALSRALEEFTLRSEAGEVQTPYPGLASFQTQNSEFFFGREQEVETLIKKLQQQNLLALIGPSGAGKTSFLQAGLIPSLPKEWCSVLTHPGNAPMNNLRQYLAPLLPEDKRAFEEPQAAIRILLQKHLEVVLIVDRFEELFTLNPPEVQAHFAEMLGRAATETNVRVLLSMRDDFLIFCKEHLPLVPIFSELSAMLPLSGAGLRRALVQPALKCGYRFEDETLVDDILRDLEKERGALPLLAFAASLLWEQRDRQKGELTRKAYEEIGGVQGALAQHAETMMAQLGTHQEPIVREIFRNLITAQRTRIARDSEELLSVFHNHPETARKVLRVLIDSRLLTSSENRIEISHESLTTRWPRLVKWQAQEAEGAQIRDQLRQVAQVWAEKERSPDLLWTGTAFLEFQLWRQLYPGGLSRTEEEFAQAMTLNANRKRRRRQLTVIVIFAALLITLGVITNFWHKTSVARDEALAQAKRAEAGVVLNLGRAIQDADPTTKLAYATASLELTDTYQGRRFALQALSEGPVAHIMEVGTHVSLELSPDGRCIAAGRWDGAVNLLAHDGSATVTVQKPFQSGSFFPWNSQFSPDGNLLLWTSREDPGIVKVWSLPQKKLARTFDLAGLTRCLVRGDRAFFITDTTRRKELPLYWKEVVIRTWRFDQNEPEILGRFNLQINGWSSFDIDQKGQWISYRNGRQVCIRSLDISGIGTEQLIGTHEKDVIFIRFRPNGNQIASSDSSEIRLWSLIPGSEKPARTISGTGGHIWFDPKGAFLFGMRGNGLAQCDLSNASVDPVVFRATEIPQTAISVIFDKQERWLATGVGSTLAVYPWKRSHPYIYSSSGSASNSQFTPDGTSLLMGSDRDGIRIRSVPEEKQSPERTLWNSDRWNAESIDVDRFAKYVLFATPGDGVHLISISDGKDLVLNSSLPGKQYVQTVFAPDGRTVAAAGITGIQVWDLESGKSRILEQSKSLSFLSIKFSSDGGLIAGDVAGKLYRWNLNDDSSKILDQSNNHPVASIAISRDGRYLAVARLSTMNFFEIKNATSKLILYDLELNKTASISSHGNRVRCVALGLDGSTLVTGDLDGIVRVGPISGESPHLLLGHSTSVGDVVFHPGGEWIASTESDAVVRLWRMPQGKPLASLSYNEFLNYLRDQTNVRVVADKGSLGGYRIHKQPFYGWK